MQKNRLALFHFLLYDETSFSGGVSDLHNHKHLIKYLISLLLYGTNGYIASFISLNSYEIVFMRCILGSALLVLLFFLSGNRLDILKYRKDVFRIAVSGIAMAGDWLFLFEAYKQIGVTLSILLNYLGPVLVMAFAPIVLHEKLVARKVLALFAALAGVILISGSAAISGINLFGIFCAFMSAVCYAILVLVDKKCEDIVGMPNATLQLFFTMLSVVVFLALRQGLHVEIRQEELIPLIWLGLINTGLACFFYFSSIGYLSAQTVSVLGYLEPLIGVLTGALLLGERMTVLQILGAVLIIGGALFGEMNFRRKTSA